MKLLTKAIAKTIPGDRATENLAPEQKMAVAKFFDPTGAGTWYVFEAYARVHKYVDAQTGQVVHSEEGVEKSLREVDLSKANLNEVEDVIFFGYVTGLGFNELGSFSLSELQNFKGRFGLGIERDIHYTPESFATIQRREG